MASNPTHQVLTKMRHPASRRKQRVHRTTSSMKKELTALRELRLYDKEHVPSAPKLKMNKNYLHTPENCLKFCSSVAKSMVQVEYKLPIQPFKGSAAPVSLSPPDIGYQYAETKESIIMRDSFRSLFGDRHYRFRISTALNMSSSGAGAVNSTISNSVLVSNPDFVSLATVFNEYFVCSFHLKWMPVSRYQYPLTGVTATSVANLPLGKADLQHGQAAYSSLSTMTENFAFGYHSTGDPFSDNWINTEKSTEQVVASLTAPTQSWCNVNNASNYQGTLQFLSQSAPPALPISQVLGTFAVHWDIIFRVRA